MRSRSVDHGAGLTGLGLSSATVAELRSQSQELPGSGGRFCGCQPETTEFTSLHNVLGLMNSQKQSLKLGIHAVMCCLIFIPEECVMLHTHFPQFLGSLVVGQFKANGAFVMFQLKHTVQQRLTVHMGDSHEQKNHY